MRPTLEKMEQFLSDGCVNLDACAEIEDNYEAVILRFFEHFKNAHAQALRNFIGIAHGEKGHLKWERVKEDVELIENISELIGRF